MADIFMTWKIYFLSKFPWSFSQGSDQQYFNIGLDNGLAPTRQQAIISTNGG